MIFAVDFDGTLVEDKFPHIGSAKLEVQNKIKQLKSAGHKIILWTCRTEEYLQAAVDYCKQQGIVFDAVNENLPEVEVQFGGNPRKIYADIYVDDRNLGILNFCNTVFYD